MLFTVIAILAVDFQIFPRRFAKVEMFGLSLMDTGVGGFVFSMGCAYGLRKLRMSTSSTTKTVEDSTTVKKNRRGRSASRSRSKVTDVQKEPVNAADGANFWASVRSSVPLLMLGLGRLALVKGTDYQEHVSEYGLHWNFFFTLGSLQPLVALGEMVTVGGAYSFVGLITGGVYQLLLSTTGLEQWVMYAPRADLISANKEGLCSLFGYTSIFFFGVTAGQWIHTLSQKVQSPRFLRNIIHLDILLWSLYYFGSEWMGWQTSRRLANAMYILFVVALNILVIVGLALMKADEMLRVPAIYEAVNKNSLFVFLLANISTGLVNHSFYTVRMDDLSAMTLLSLYVGGVVAVAVVMYDQKVRVKI